MIYTIGKEKYFTLVNPMKQEITLTRTTTNIHYNDVAIPKKYSITSDSLEQINTICNIEESSGPYEKEIEKEEFQQIQKILTLKQSNKPNRI